MATWMWTAWWALAGCSWHNTPFPPAPSVDGVEGEVGRSNLTIPRGQTFELGGEQATGFAVRIENVGATTVDVTADDATTPVEPGDVVDATVPPSQMARLYNRSSRREARLKVVYVQSQPEFLGMRYVEDAATP